MSGPEPRRGRFRVLVVGEEELCSELRSLLEPIGAQVREAARGEQALEILRAWAPHVMLVDLVRGAISGMDLLGHVRQHQPRTRVLMVSGSGTIELAVEAIQRGAVDFLTRPIDPGKLLAQVERHGQQALALERVDGIESQGEKRPATIVAEDRRMRGVLELAGQVGPTVMPVLICGESGTGKELIARTIHANSRDPSLPFLPVNSAALPDTLLESELFGHLKGAFTGADSHRQGIFVEARGGTVFLDEIALMSVAFQGKLLRVLQEHTVTPLGSSTPKPVVFRLVAATNRSLRERIAMGKFREDLYYRLRVVTIHVPPLRERPDDIVPLARHFLALHAGQVGIPPERRPSLTAEAVAALQSHRWPGNVRELENSLQRALLLCRGEDIRSDHLRLDEQSHPWPRETSQSLSYEEGKQRVLAGYQRHVVERALRTSGGNVSRAAEACGLTRSAFQRLMRQLEIDRRRFQGDL